MAAPLAFPATDPVGPSPGVAGDPAVRTARRLAAQLLGPTAAASDAGGVPLSHLRALGEAGLLGLGVGDDASPAVAREVAEVLAAACGSTWFCATQHTTPAAMVAASDDAALRAELGAPLAAGRLLAGVGFAHVRRPGPPAVTARRSGDGWVLDGRLDWVTSWGIADVLLVGAAVDDPGAEVAGGRGQLVFVVLDAVDQPGLSAAPLGLAAMGGTHTHRVDLDAVAVPPGRTAAVVDAAAWRAQDAARTVHATPASFGPTRAALAQLAALAAARGADDQAELAQALAGNARALRARAYALREEADPDPAEALALRAQVVDLGLRATAALVVAQGGSAMLTDDPAQRWAREALFSLVQAQTRTSAAAVVALLADQVAAPAVRGR